MCTEGVVDVQLCLFPTKLVWHEFPQHVRSQINQLLEIMCIDIVEALPASDQERYDESRSHSSLAP